MQKLASVSVSFDTEYIVSSPFTSLKHIVLPSKLTCSLCSEAEPS